MQKRIFLFHSGKTFPVMEDWALRRQNAFLPRTLLKLAGHLGSRRNPRSLDLMAARARELFSDFDPQQLLVLDGKCDLPRLDWTAIDEIVLLWPDGNGTGWTGIERRVFKMKQRSARVIIVNGRRRCFLLERRSWRVFQWKRFLEKTPVVEIGAVLIFIVTSPWLALWDFPRAEKMK